MFHQYYKWIRCFHAVAKTGGFTTAARYLHIGQPTVTDQVKALSYINMNWEALGMWTGRGWGDSRVQGSAIAEQWKAATTDARFLKSSETLYQELGL